MFLLAAIFWTVQVGAGFVAVSDQEIMDLESQEILLPQCPSFPRSTSIDLTQYLTNNSPAIPTFGQSKILDVHVLPVLERAVSECDEIPSWDLFLPTVIQLDIFLTSALLIVGIVVISQRILVYRSRPRFYCCPYNVDPHYDYLYDKKENKTSFYVPPLPYIASDAKQTVFDEQTLWEIKFGLRSRLRLNVFPAASTGRPILLSPSDALFQFDQQEKYLGLCSSEDSDATDAYATL
jgi:hypothetical protein